jgi:rod shape-determining protein MreC
MFSLRRWWDKNVAKTAYTVLAIGGGWLLWQTQATMLLETYQTISRPFQPDPYKFDTIASARTQQLQDQLAELQAQNRKMKQLIQSPNELPEQNVAAPVIGRSPDNWWQRVMVGRGASEGIQVGWIVLGEGGLVGRVTQVTPHTSQVLLVTDPSSRVGVVASRSRQMGYIQGNSDRSDTVVLQFFDKTPDVKVGDVISTSVVSQLFPGGLIVGRVVAMNLTKAPAPEASVKLTAPVNALEWVRLYPMKKGAILTDLDAPTPAAPVVKKP